MQRADVAIAGAGVIGLSLALELRGRGLRVVVADRGAAGAGASRAAAGMLAARDAANPAELGPLATLSVELYPKFLSELQRASGFAVLFETGWTLERNEGGSVGRRLLPAMAEEAGRFCWLRESSLDPRALHAALLTAVRAKGVEVLEHTELRVTATGMLRVMLPGEQEIACDTFLDCTGAWSGALCRPVKGQMLRVQLPPDAMRAEGWGNVVVRTPEVYVVPRRDGTAVIGATLEEAGFDVTVRQDAIAELRARAARLLPAIADAPEWESWAGLRPGTLDGLPVLGRVGEGAMWPRGTFRNGVLLAPGTARVMAEMMLGERTSVELGAFDPGRFDPGHLTRMRAGDPVFARTE